MKKTKLSIYQLVKFRFFSQRFFCLFYHSKASSKCST